MPAEPVRPAPDELESGKEDSQWIEVTGIVRRVRREGVLVGLDLAGASGEFTAQVYAPEGLETPGRLVDAEVRLRGVCGGKFNTNRQLLGINMFVPDLQHVLVDRPGPESAYLAPAQPINSLLQFSAARTGIHRAKIKGAVTLQRPGKALYLQDGTGGIYIETEQANQVNPGDMVEAAGFPAHEGYSPVLKYGVFRKVGDGKPVTPIVAGVDEIMSGKYDAQAIEIVAELLEMHGCAASARSRAILQPIRSCRFRSACFLARKAL